MTGNGGHDLVILHQMKKMRNRVIKAGGMEPKKVIMHPELAEKLLYELEIIGKSPILGIGLIPVMRMDVIQDRRVVPGMIYMGP